MTPGLRRADSYVPFRSRAWANQATLERASIVAAFNSGILVPVKPGGTFRSLVRSRVRINGRHLGWLVGLAFAWLNP